MISQFRKIVLRNKIIIKMQMTKNQENIAHGFIEIISQIISESFCKIGLRVGGLRVSTDYKFFYKRRLVNVS